MNTWIDIADQPIPLEKEVLVIWKGRVGILFIDEYNGRKDMAICPGEFQGIVNDMDQECFNRITYWMPLPEIPNF